LLIRGADPRLLRRAPRSRQSATLRVTLQGRLYEPSSL
jgi:hypothetical protein